MSQSLLPYAVPSGSQPTVNQSFTGVTSIAPPQSELNSSNVNVQAKVKKEYNDPSSYKPTGNLIYNTKLLQRIEDKTT